MGGLILRWLRPSPAGTMDRATFRLRLVLAIQIAVFGLVGYLVLSLGRSTSMLLALPELVAHVALGLLLWNNRINFAGVITVAAVGVVGISLGERNALEIMLIFFVIPFVLPFYARTSVALTTQILVWVMVAGAGSGAAVMASDRMPWTALVVQISAIGLVGTLMVIFRYSLLRLIGANQRLENSLIRYQVLYDNGDSATLVLGPAGYIREVHGAATELLGAGPKDLLGQHYTVLPTTAIGPRAAWETHLRADGSKEPTTDWTRPTGRAAQRLSIHLATGTEYQRAMGVALVAEVRSGEPRPGPDGKESATAS